MKKWSAKERLEMSKRLDKAVEKQKEEMKRYLFSSQSGIIKFRVRAYCLLDACLEILGNLGYEVTEIEEEGDEQVAKIERLAGK